ncbi:MAG: hypothetical protein HAW67_03440 [Endozoicomonadaceae bacterium]|nr:hypothetical protein [Endozoicomonadaceae bacterium]
MPVLFSQSQNIEFRTHILTLLGEAFKVEDNEITSIGKSVFGKNTAITNIPLSDFFDTIGFNIKTLVSEHTPYNSVATFIGYVQWNKLIRSTVINNIQMLDSHKHELAKVVSRALQSNGFSGRFTNSHSSSLTITDIIEESFDFVSGNTAIKEVMDHISKTFSSHNIDIFKKDFERLTPPSVFEEKGLAIPQAVGNVYRHLMTNNIEDKKILRNFDMNEHSALLRAITINVFKKARYPLELGVKVMSNKLVEKLNELEFSVDSEDEHAITSSLDDVLLNCDDYELPPIRAATAFLKALSGEHQSNSITTPTLKRA